MARFFPAWRKATWALLIFTVWMIVMWATTGSVAPIVMWFIGLLVVVILWFLTSNKLNVPIYGPAGQQWIVSAATAERRVRSGWSYQPQATRP
jgi:hypothetical protein